MKFSLTKLFLLSGAIVLSFFFGFQTKASVFYDDFDSASFRNIYSGDECKLGTRAGGTGSVADKWNAYYQDTSCIDEADCLNCVIQDYCNSGVDPCCSKSCSNGGLDENWGHNEHGADANIEVLSEDSISKLKMFRGDITLENVCGADQIVGPYAHRFMLLESADRLLDSALDTFKLETKVKVSDLTGWGVGWELGSMVRGWYLNSEDDFIVTFSGIESGGRPVEWRAAANDSEWHTIEVIGRGLVREAWVGGNVRCASEKDNSCVLSSDPGVSCNRCKVGEGNISSFSTSSETGYIWMGNRVNQYGGCGYCPVAPVNEGPGPWPTLEMDYIHLYKGPENGDVAPDSGCSGDSQTFSFTTTHTDSDGDFDNVQFLINSGVNIAVLGSGTDPMGFFWGKLEKTLSGSFQFCLRDDMNSSWDCNPDPENSYVQLITTGASPSGYSCSPSALDCETLNVTWQIKIKEGTDWQTEDANLWLYSEDEQGFKDEFEDKGNFGIDNSAPLSPGVSGKECWKDSPSFIITKPIDPGCSDVDYYKIERAWDVGEDFGLNNAASWVYTPLSPPAATTNTYIKVYARDAVGNWGPYTQKNFSIDKDSPSSSNASPVCFDTENPVLGVSSTDTGCGADLIEYQFQLDYDSDHTSWDQSRSWGDGTWETSFNLPDGTYYFRVNTRDEAGNEVWSSWWNFRIPCNRPPQAINLSAREGDYCFSPHPPIFLSWEFDDLDNTPPGADPQSAYQVQIDNNSDFSFREVDSGKVSSLSETYAPVNLSSNTTYYWRVRVWDNSDLISDCGHSEGWCYPSPDSFLTDHAYPYPDFSWSPESPSVDGLIRFKDETDFHGSDPVTWTWDWDFGDGEISTDQNPTHTYISSADYDVILTACDGGRCCATEEGVNMVNVQLPLPDWREVAPF